MLQACDWGYCHDFLLGILEESGDDFSSTEELYESVGDILQGADDTKSEDEIMVICEKLLQVTQM